MKTDFSTVVSCSGFMIKGKLPRVTNIRRTSVATGEKPNQQAHYFNHTSKTLFLNPTAFRIGLLSNQIVLYLNINRITSL